MRAVQTTFTSQVRTQMPLTGGGAGPYLDPLHTVNFIAPYRDMPYLCYHHVPFSTLQFHITLLELG
jgi:hypothetical protein